MSNLMDEGVFITSKKDFIEKCGCTSKRELVLLLAKIDELSNDPKGNAFQQLKEWRKIGKKVAGILYAAGEISEATQTQIDRLSEKTGERSNRRWSEKEDEALIDMICQENTSILEISLIFGRSPAAIKSRVSQLVGVKRLSQEVVGKFIGTLNGANIEGSIKGQLFKQNPSKNKQKEAAGETVSQSDQ